MRRRITSEPEALGSHRLRPGSGLFALWMAPLVLAMTAAAADVERTDARTLRWLEPRMDAWVETYRELHAHPELSLQEEKTAAFVAKRLREAGYEVTTGVGGHGVVAVLENGRGPVVLFRADMDALPVVEDTGLPYASHVRATQEDGSEVGVMHACGHDVHVTHLLAVAEAMASHRDAWQGTLLLVVQPAEELGRGALAMIDDGLFDRFPKPDAALALHVESSMPAGHMGLTSGWAMANVDAVDVTIFGRGGHGARPHQAVDPIVAAAHFVTALQTVVSRRVSPQEPAVITVGSIQGGAKHNVIPDSVHLKLTVRSYTDAVRATLLEGIREIAVGTCEAQRCTKPPEISIRESYTPAVYNDPALALRAKKLFAQTLGAEHVDELAPSMGGEDFGRYGRSLGAPSLLYRLGAAPPAAWEESRQPGGAPLPSLHSSRFAPDAERALETGVRATVVLLTDLLDGGNGAGRAE
jgi:hippurate hydrolase